MRSRRSTKPHLQRSLQSSQSHNRRLEEDQMWASHSRTRVRRNSVQRERAGRSASGAGASRQLRMDQPTARRAAARPRRPAEGSRRPELDSVMRRARRDGGEQNMYWTKKLLDFEDKEPGRWGHSGFRELYLDEPQEGKTGERSGGGGGGGGERREVRVNSRATRAAERPTERQRAGATRDRARRSGDRDGHARAGRGRDAAAPVDRHRSGDRGRPGSRRSGSGRSPRAPADRKRVADPQRRKDTRPAPGRRSPGRSRRRSSSGSSYTSYTGSSSSWSRSRSPRSRGSRSRSRSSSWSSSTSVTSRSVTPHQPAPREQQPRRTAAPRDRRNGRDAAPSAPAVKTEKPPAVAPSVRKKEPPPEKAPRRTQNGRSHASAGAGNATTAARHKEPTVSRKPRRPGSSPPRDTVTVTRKLNAAAAAAPPRRARVAPPPPAPLAGRESPRPPSLPPPVGARQRAVSESAESSSSSSAEQPTRTSLSERFGRLAQLSVQRGDAELVRLKIVKDANSVDKKVILEEEPGLEAADGCQRSRERVSFETEYREYFGQKLRRSAMHDDPAEAAPRTLPRDWETDVSVRYRYYRDAGYFRDRMLSLQEYIKWEQWWYRYREWLRHQQRPAVHVAPMRPVYVEPAMERRRRY